MTQQIWLAFLAQQSAAQQKKQLSSISDHCKRFWAVAVRESFQDFLI
jgi:hypothetical protein